MAKLAAGSRGCEVLFFSVACLVEAGLLPNHFLDSLASTIVTKVGSDEWLAMNGGRDGGSSERHKALRAFSKLSWVICNKMPDKTVREAAALKIVEILVVSRRGAGNTMETLSTELLSLFAAFFSRDCLGFGDSTVGMILPAWSGYCSDGEDSEEGGGGCDEEAMETITRIAVFEFKSTFSRCLKALGGTGQAGLELVTLVKRTMSSANMMMAGAAAWPELDGLEL